MEWMVRKPGELPGETILRWRAKLLRPGISELEATMIACAMQQAIDLDELSIQLRRLADSSEFGNGLRGE
jgi:hypothetical protein